MKKRILIYSSCHIHGGSEKLIESSINLLSNNSTNEFEVNFIGGYSKKNKEKMSLNCKTFFPKLLLTNILIHSVRNNSFKYLLIRIFVYLGLLELYNSIIFYFMLMKIKPDIIHINSGGLPGAKSNLSLIIASKLIFKKNIRLIYQLNNTPARISTFEKAILNKCDIVFTHSKSNEIKVKKILKYPIIKYFNSFFTIHNKKTFCKCNDHSSDLVSVGFLEERKGHLNFLKIASEYLISNNMKYIIVGDGPEYNNMKKYISNNGLEKNVFLVGYKECYEKYINNSRLLIHPSLGNEDMPLTIINSFELGKPVLASSVAGIKEHIINGDNGYLLENVFCEKEVLDKLEHLLKNKTLLRNISVNSKLTYEKFDKKTYLNNLIQLYNT